MAVSGWGRESGPEIGGDSGQEVIATVWRRGLPGVSWESMKSARSATEIFEVQCKCRSVPVRYRPAWDVLLRTAGRMDVAHGVGADGGSPFALAQCAEHSVCALDRPGDRFEVARVSGHRVQAFMCG